MWRALILAVGITLIMLGAQLFFVEQLEIKRVRPAKKPPAQVFNNGFGESPFQQASFQSPLAPDPPKTLLYTPKDWMPWSLLAVGTVVVIYTFTIPSLRSKE